MVDGTETPPGLEALANHLGYTFVKKDQSADTDSTADSKDDTVQSATDSATEDTKESKETTEKDAEIPKVPKGSLNSYGNIYFNSDDETWTAKEPEDTEPAENEDTAGHAVLIRRKKSKDSRKKYHIDSLIIQSQKLKDALGEILEDYPGVCCNLDRLVFEEPFEPFVHRWAALLAYLQREDLDGVTKDHLTLLHGILSKELEDTIKAVDDYISNGVATYEHAWIVFQPGAVIVASSGSDQIVALKLKSGSYVSTPDQGNMYRMLCERVDWNGKSFGWASEYVQLKEFKGIIPITDLDAYPLSFHSKKETIKRSLIERGKAWAELAGTHYRSYDGPAIQRTRDGNILVQTQGRIIIDTDTFCKQWDQCKIYTRHLNSSSTSEEDEECEWENPANDFNTLLSLKKESEEKKSQLTDYQYMLCSPLLRGYSLKSKKWLSFYVHYVQDIKWDKFAFDNLVLPQSQKRIILALSKTQVDTMNGFDDFITNKGKGMILLLSGPPGVGKTLTAEAVSETMKVPLFMMSAGDLGVRPDEVETNLENVLEMVAKWKAILLIDECDVFLEARSVHDLDRNRLVSIFLRLLEYYQGTLFLTTNRAQNMDPAFQSRIHVHMEYSNLNAGSRKAIWSSFLSRLPSNFNDEELNRVAELPLNGRQIKNIVKTAQLLALDEKKQLAMEHVEAVTAIERGFQS